MDADFEIDNLKNEIELIDEFISIANTTLHNINTSDPVYSIINDAIIKLEDAREDIDNKINYIDSQLR